MTACGNQQQEGKKRRRKKRRRQAKTYCWSVYEAAVISANKTPHVSLQKDTRKPLVPHRPGGTYALCLGVFVCLFKGTVHSKLKFHHVLLSAVSTEALVAFHITVPDFHGGKELHSVDTYCGQVKKKKLDRWKHLLWCVYPSVWKTWQSGFSQNSDVNAMFLAKFSL